MIEIFILSLIQGITEFLPISSSSHLILASEYLNFENKSLSIDVSLHIGSFLAVTSFFYKDIINFYKNRILFLKILVSSIPIMIFGFFLIKTNLIENVDEEDYWVIGNGIFNQFETTVDYFSETLYLTPISNHKMTIRYNLMGLEVRKLLSGEFLVRYVMPNLPGEGAGIKAGDVITHLNTIPTKKISKDEWLTYSTHPATYTLCLEHKACVELTSQHIPGYSTH